MPLPKPQLDHKPPTARRPHLTRPRRDRRHDLDVALLLVFGGRYLPNDIAERLAAGRERA